MMIPNLISNGLERINKFGRIQNELDVSVIDKKETNGQMKAFRGGWWWWGELGEQFVSFQRNNCTAFQAIVSD